LHQCNSSGFPHVHRTALDLSVANQFGTELGGFWLLNDQVEELRKLADYYPPNEVKDVARAVEAYASAASRLIQINQ
jgi:hypothetical protein